MLHEHLPQQESYMEFSAFILPYLIVVGNLEMKCDLLNGILCIHTVV